MFASHLHYDFVEEGVHTQKQGIQWLDPPAIAIVLSRRRRDERMNGVVETTTGSLPETQLPWTVV